MGKIQIEDLYTTEQYESVRPEYRQRMMDVKKPRRINVGPLFNFLFENKDTMKYQIQEMIRIEGILESKAIQHEIDTYNEMVPGPDEIKATLLIEIDDPAARAYKLKELVGVQDCVSLLIARDYQVHADFDDRQVTDGKISSVHYLTFSLSREAADAFLSTSEVEILVNHPAYSYQASLTDEQLSALKEDLRGC